MDEQRIIDAIEAATNRIVAAIENAASDIGSAMMMWSPGEKGSGITPKPKKTGRAKRVLHGRYGKRSTR
jgi:hypothetical protein